MEEKRETWETRTREDRTRKGTAKVKEIEEGVETANQGDGIDDTEKVEIQGDTGRDNKRVG